MSTPDDEVEYHDTYGGLVIDRDRCAYCAAVPSLPCALHSDRRGNK